MSVSRRAVLGFGSLVALTGCSSSGDGENDSAPTSSTPSSVAPKPTPVLTSSPEIAALEQQYDARIGVFGLDLGSGATFEHRAGERFAMCSTWKTLAVGALLNQEGVSGLGRRIQYSKADLVTYSPVTQQHVRDGMTLRDLCHATITVSDNTAGNLILAELGGPAALTRWLGSLDDRLTRLDRTETALNEATPGDPRDTTSPHAIASDYQRLAVGSALKAPERAQLVSWLRANTTGDQRIRAAVPKGWTVGDKTGSGSWGSTNDVAILWPPGEQPLCLAVLTTDRTKDAKPVEDLVTRAAAIALAQL